MPATARHAPLNLLKETTMKKISVLFTCVVALNAASAYAQYVGPSSTAPVVTTVRELLANAKDDQEAAFQGLITKHLGGDNYQFSDGTGEIIVEIDKKYFPAGQPVSANTKVKINGKYDKELIGKSKFDVKRLEIVTGP
jgi:uncharacterized protein (TIGR00156 family)